MAETHNYGTGKRKTAIARVFLQRGSGSITVNGRVYDEYFQTENQRAAVRRPFEVVEGISDYDASITVRGGGLRGQAEAVRHGIARALIDADADFRDALKDEGLLTRDSRKKERKKYGQRGARARFQFSKR